MSGKVDMFAFTVWVSVVPPIVFALTVNTYASRLSQRKVKHRQQRVQL